MTVSEERPGRRPRCRSRVCPLPGYSAHTDLCAALEGAYVLEDRAREPGLSRLRDQHIAAAPCRRARIPSRPRPHNSWAADDARAPLRAAVGRHRRRQGRDCRRRAPDGPRAGSCARLLERFAAALTCNQDATVSERPCDRAANPRMANELAIPIPHGALERERQLVTTRPSLDLDKLARPRVRLSVIVSRRAPRPAQPENETTATVAPRRSSSSHTASRAASSPRPGRSRAACGREASRPDGVWTGRPAARCRSRTGAPASPARRASSAPDQGASSTSTDLVGSESQAPPSSTGTAHPAMRGGRSR